MYLDLAIDQEIRSGVACWILGLDCQGLLIILSKIELQIKLQIFNKKKILSGFTFRDNLGYRSV